MIDCEVSDWVDKGECTVSCGGGQQLQTRYVTVEPAHGGQICPEAYEQYVPCSVEPCPVDCDYSDWTGLSKCDTWCGPGTNVKTRDVLLAVCLTASLISWKIVFSVFRLCLSHPPSDSEERVIFREKS